MLGWLTPTVGEVQKNGHLRIGQYNQHSEDQLDLTKSPYEFLRDLYPNGIVTEKGLERLDVEAWRQKIGQFGTRRAVVGHCLRAVAARACSGEAGSGRGGQSGRAGGRPPRHHFPSPPPHLRLRLRLRPALPCRAPQASRATASSSPCSRCRTASSRASSSA